MKAQEEATDWPESRKDRERAYYRQEGAPAMAGRVQFAVLKQQVTQSGLVIRTVGRLTEGLQPTGPVVVRRDTQYASSRGFLRFSPLRDTAVFEVFMVRESSRSALVFHYELVPAQLMQLDLQRAGIESEKCLVSDGTLESVDLDTYNVFIIEQLIRDGNIELLVKRIKAKQPDSLIVACVADFAIAEDWSDIDIDHFLLSPPSGRIGYLVADLLEGRKLPRYLRPDWSNRKDPATRQPSEGWLDWAVRESS